MSELLRNWLFSSLLGVNQEVRLPQSFETIAVDKTNTLEISLTDGKKGEKKEIENGYTIYTQGQASLISNLLDCVVIWTNKFILHFLSLFCEKSYLTHNLESLGIFFASILSIFFFRRLMPYLYEVFQFLLLCISSIVYLWRQYLFFFFLVYCPLLPAKTTSQNSDPLINLEYHEG